MSEFRCCALVPTYDNPMTIEAVVDRIRPHPADIIVVDDGSAEPGRAAFARLEREGRALGDRLVAEGTGDVPERIGA